jgi:hypothetical protein
MGSRRTWMRQDQQAIFKPIHKHHTHSGFDNPTAEPYLPEALSGETMDRICLLSDDLDGRHFLS